MSSCPNNCSDVGVCVDTICECRNRSPSIDCSLSLLDIYGIYFNVWRYTWGVIFCVIFIFNIMFFVWHVSLLFRRNTFDRFYQQLGRWREEIAYFRNRMTFMGICLILIPLDRMIYFFLDPLAASGIVSWGVQSLLFFTSFFFEVACFYSVK